MSGSGLRPMGRTREGARLVSPWKCMILGHKWGWAREFEVFGHHRAGQPCRRCPAMKWLGPPVPLRVRG